MLIKRTISIYHAYNQYFAALRETKTTRTIVFKR